MGGFEFGEELLDVTAFALIGLSEALADALVSIGEGGDVLNDSRRLSLDRQAHGPLAPFELFHQALFKPTFWVFWPRRRKLRRLRTWREMYYNSYIQSAIRMG